jgi:hypothetical protein
MYTRFCGEQIINFVSFHSNIEKAVTDFTFHAALKIFIYNNHHDEYELWSNTKYRETVKDQVKPPVTSFRSLTHRFSECDCYQSRVFLCPLSQAREKLHRS